MDGFTVVCRTPSAEAPGVRQTTVKPSIMPISRASTISLRPSGVAAGGRSRQKKPSLFKPSAATGSKVKARLPL